MVTQNSVTLFEKAREVLVGGVNSPVRSFMAVGGSPFVVKAGHGAKILDVDGNSYVDYCLSWGASVLGHAHKDVVKAVKKAISGGSSFGVTTKPEIEIAQQIVKDVPSINKVRFVNSGTEATMSAIRLARGFTGRNMIVKFDGCYHGHFDDLLISAGSGVANLKKSSSLGITQNHILETISLPYNDIAVLTETLNRYKGDIACVIIEPVAGNMGVVVAQKEFLKILRELTRKYKMVLIFDEVMSGYRSSRGGVQAEFNVIPDMTCLGKIIGGGFPVGAYGGRRDIMDRLAPLGGVYQAGTFSGTPVVMSAGLAILKNLDKTFYRQLNKKSLNFANQLNSYFDKKNLPVHLAHYNSMLSVRFRRKTVLNYHDAQAASSREIYGRLFHVLLNKSIYWPPADLEAFFISAAHTPADLANLSLLLQQFFQNEF